MRRKSWLKSIRRRKRGRNMEDDEMEEKCQLEKEGKEEESKRKLATNIKW